VLPVVWDELSPEARAVIDKQGVVYTDRDGDLVTSIVNGKTVYLLVTMKRGIVIALSRKHIGEEKQTFINRCLAICILYG